ncbi:hypothetical protein D3C71_1769250 [compost metagenome]
MANKQILQKIAPLPVSHNVTYAFHARKQNHAVSIETQAFQRILAHSCLTPWHAAPSLIEHPTGEAHEVHRRFLRRVKVYRTSLHLLILFHQLWDGYQGFLNTLHNQVHGRYSIVLYLDCFYLIFPGKPSGLRHSLFQKYGYVHNSLH